MINMRKEVGRLLQENGHPILLQRTDRKLRCRCFNDKYQEPDAKCPFCFGSGWVSRIERHMTRGDSAVQTISRTNLGQQTEIGRMWIDARTFYLQHDTHPKVGDMMYEVGWDSNQKPTHLMAVYEINDVFPSRDRNGRIEYWTVSAKSRTTNFAIKEVLVRSIGPIKNYELKGR